jgi:hypothetical protein
MINSNKIFTLLILLSGFCNNAFSENINPCPAALVSFWNEFANSTNNTLAVPDFLLKNKCIKSRVSSEFYSTTSQRFDHPEKAVLVDQLYAQLSWEDKKSFTK